MKRIYSFLVAAVAVFAAVSCTQELSQNDLNPEGEVVVFEASVDGVDGKAYLDGTLSKWHTTDQITIHNGNGGFAFATSEEDITNEGTTARFTYEGEDFSGEKFMAVYPAGNYTVDVEGKTVYAKIPEYQQAEDGTYHKDASIAVAYTEDRTLAFKNATALLKFTMNMDDITHVYFKGNNSEAVVGDIQIELQEGSGNDHTVSVTCLGTPENCNVAECYYYGGTFTKGKTFYMAVAPQTFEGGVELSVKRLIENADPEIIVVRSTDSKVVTKANTILDLGEIGGMSYSTETRVEKIYLKPDLWDTSGAWYAAHFFNPIGGTQDIKMEASDEYSGLYEISVPEGVDKVILCRMDSNAESFDWSHVWNQTNNLDIPVSGDENVCYHVTAYGNDGEPSAGQWITLEDATKVVPEWSIAGTFNNWDIYSTPFVEEGNYLVAKNVKFEVNAEFKILNNGTTWYKVNNFAMDKWCSLLVDTPNELLNAGSYDFYLCESKLYVTTAGSKTPSAPGVIEAQDGWVYLLPNSNWTQANARFSIYLCNGSKTNQWLSMSKIEDTRYYGVKLPSDFNKTNYKNIIFVRLNPSTTANNWNDGTKWNQTADLDCGEITDKKNNCYAIKADTWDKGGGTWSKLAEIK